MRLETLVRLFCCCCSVGCVSTTTSSCALRLLRVSEGVEKEGKEWLGLELLGGAAAATATVAAIENGMIGVG
uniref:Putative secreted protein n=1 Tax=Anopheles darlingi TaxID=43151 RepID=A0A2M4DQX2_ANODA